MVNGKNAPFVVPFEKAKEFLQQSADSRACERLMDKARLHIPDFDNKQVKRKEVSAWLAERRENGKA